MCCFCLNAAHVKSDVVASCLFGLRDGWGLEEQALETKFTASFLRIANQKIDNQLRFAILHSIHFLEVRYFEKNYVNNQGWQFYTRSQNSNNIQSRLSLCSQELCLLPSKHCDQDDRCTPQGRKYRRHRVLGSSLTLFDQIVDVERRPHPGAGHRRCPRSRLGQLR